MRIAVDISPWVHHHAGLGRYAGELVAALTRVAPAASLVGLYNSPRPLALEAPLAQLETAHVPLNAKPWRLSVLLAYLLRVNMDRWLPSADVFHATDHLLPRLGRAATVFTIHDLIFRFFPEYHLPLNRWYLRLMLPRFIRRADALIAVSNHTARDVAQWLDIPREKLTVVYEGVNPRYQPLQDRAELERVRAVYRLPPRFILFLGTIEPRKNLLTLLESYAALLNSHTEVPPLVVAGRKGWLYKPTLARIDELGLTEHIRLTDWIAEADVPALLNLAEVFVYPSLYEGFGLPPLEAMACGTPVVCSNASSLPEVVSDAGILFDPRDSAALTNALGCLLDSPTQRAELRARGIARARRFTWERAARETLAVYQRAAAK